MASNHNAVREASTPEPLARAAGFPTHSGGLIAATPRGVARAFTAPRSYWSASGRLATPSSSRCPCSCSTRCSRYSSRTRAEACETARMSSSVGIHGGGWAIWAGALRSHCGGMSVWLIRRDMRAHGRTLERGVFGLMLLESVVLACCSARWWGRSRLASVPVRARPGWLDRVARLVDEADDLARRGDLRGVALPGDPRVGDCRCAKRIMGLRPLPAASSRRWWELHLLGVSLHRPVRRSARARVVHLSNDWWTRVLGDVFVARVWGDGVDPRSLRCLSSGVLAATI